MCVGLLIIMGPWSCDCIFLIISQISNPMNLSWLDFFFFLIVVGEENKERSHPKDLTILHKNHMLFSSFSLSCFREILYHNSGFSYLFLNKGSTETPTREGWAENVLDISSQGWESERLLTGSFPAHWHRHKWKQHIHFVQFALPSHMELVHVKGC